MIPERKTICVVGAPSARGVTIVGFDVAANAATGRTWCVLSPRPNAYSSLPDVTIHGSETRPGAAVFSDLSEISTGGVKVRGLTLGG